MAPDRDRLTLVVRAEVFSTARVSQVLMLVEWSAECGVDDPVLVVPWSADPSHPGSGLHFVDLRENPYDLETIPEAEHYPAMMQALRALNAPRSPVFTAKCEAWALDADELAALQFNLEAAAAETPAGFASYIDLVWRERLVFSSFHQQEQRIVRLARQAATLDLPYATLDCVLRPAMVDFEGPQEGFAVSLYVKALGMDAPAAEERWGAALEAVVGLVRSKEQTRASSSKARGG